MTGVCPPPGTSPPMRLHQLKGTVHRESTRRWITGLVNVTRRATKMAEQALRQVASPLGIGVACGCGAAPADRAIPTGGGTGADVMSRYWSEGETPTCPECGATTLTVHASERFGEHLFYCGECDYGWTQRDRRAFGRVVSTVAYAEQPRRRHTDRASTPPTSRVHLSMNQ